MKINEAIFAAKKAEDALASATTELKHYKSLIQSFFDKNNIKQFVAKVEASEEETNARDIIAKLSESVHVNYDVHALEAKFEKDMLNEFVITQYVVTDMDKLKLLAKEADISANEFKSCIRADKQVDKEALKRMHQLGDIKVSDLRGCYTAKITKKITLVRVKPEGKSGDKDCSQ